MPFDWIAVFCWMEFFYMCNIIVNAISKTVYDVRVFVWSGGVDKARLLFVRMCLIGLTWVTKCIDNKILYVFNIKQNKTQNENSNDWSVLLVLCVFVAVVIFFCSCVFVTLKRAQPCAIANIATTMESLTFHSKLEDVWLKTY